MCILKGSYNSLVFIFPAPHYIRGKALVFFFLFLFIFFCLFDIQTIIYHAPSLSILSLQMHLSYRHLLLRSERDSPPMGINSIINQVEAESSSSRCIKAEWGIPAWEISSKKTAHATGPDSTARNRQNRPS